MDLANTAGEAMEMMTRIKYAVPMTKWTVYWAIMFLVCKGLFFRKYSADFSNRIVSIVHAFAAIYYSYVTFVTWEGMFDGRVQCCYTHDSACHYRELR
jgi:hypothetical protein